MQAGIVFPSFKTIVDHIEKVGGLNMRVIFSFHLLPQCIKPFSDNVTFVLLAVLEYLQVNVRCTTLLEL